jgi:tetratricopeptide (TPR) repeat protein
MNTASMKFHSFPPGLKARRGTEIDATAGVLGAPRRAFAIFLAVFMVAGTLHAAERFYVDLLREGSSLYRQGQFQEAAEVTELACFGLLDELQQLPECLVTLALARSRAGSQEGFTKTFLRILEIEELFKAYSASSFSADLRDEFEGRVAEVIPESTLRSVPAFQGIARKKTLARLQSLSKGEQRRALEALIEEEPEEVVWRLRFADLQLDAGEAALALPHLDKVLTLTPQDGKALCLRGEALVELRRCAPAIEDLARCPKLLEDPWLAQAFAACLAETGQLAPALAFLDSLPGPTASDRTVIRLRKRLEKDARKAGVTPTAEDMPDLAAAPEKRPEEPSAGTAAEGSTPSEAKPDGASETGNIPPKSSGTAPAEVPEAKISASERSRLEELRIQLGAARKAQDLVPILSSAKVIADSQPGWSEAQHLVAEIAYRASRWDEAATYFRRGGDPGDSRPHLLFFMAVSFYETGDLQGAREALNRCRGRLQKTTFVREYEERILGS